MSSYAVPLTPPIAGLPVHATLVPFPFVCFTLALGTDIAYWQSGGVLMWQNFSEWLLFVGLVVGGVAALIGLVELLARRGLRGSGRAWLYALGNAVMLALALVNSFVHARDGWTAVVNTGLLLSAATVVVVLLTAWVGRTVAARNIAGVHAHA